MRRRIIMIVGISAVAVAIAVTAAWFFFVHQTQRAIIQWAEIQRENGVDITWQDLRLTVYPLQVEAHIDTPQVIVRRRDRRAIWKTSFLTFDFSSIAPNVIDFVSPGAHDLQFASDNATWSAVIEAETLEGQAKFSPDGYQQIEQLVGQFADVRVTPFAWVDPVTIEQGNFEATLRAATPIDPDAVHPQGNSFEFDFAARDIGLPKDLLDGYALAALGPLISVFSTEVLSKANWISDRPTSTPSPLGATAAARWSSPRSSCSGVRFASPPTVLWRSMAISNPSVLSRHESPVSSNSYRQWKLAGSCRQATLQSRESPWQF